MISAAELRAKMVVLIDAEPYRVIAAEYKKGTAKMGGMVHIKLQHLKTSNFTEKRLAPEDKVEELELETKEMEYLYTDGKEFYFMEPETYEQISLSHEVIGIGEKFIKEGDKVKIEFYKDTPVQLVLPPTIPIKVTAAGAGKRGESDATYKSVTLENNMEVMVPQFIKEGDIVLIETSTGRYVGRQTQK
jgi:elongation factor P